MSPPGLIRLGRKEMEIGFIGLGSMGFHMAASLVRAGHRLIVWNRSPEKCGPLVALGARLAQRPADVATANLVITMVADDAALRSVVFDEDGIGEHLREDAIHVSMSTTSPELSEQLARFHHERKTSYVAAPVFGGPNDAKNGTLFVLCAGKPAVLAFVMPVLESIGRRVFTVGENPAHANVIKLTGNFIVMMALEAMGEAFTLAERHGIPRQTTYEVLTQSILTDPAYVDFGTRIASHSYDPVRFKLSLGLKDSGLVLGAANSVNLPMPAADLIHQRYLTAVSKGRENLDWTSIAIGISEDGGLSVIY